MKLFLNKSNKGEYKVAQRVCSFKKKTRLTVMNMHSKLLNSHSVHPPLFDGEGIEPLTKFSKRGGGLDDRTSTFRGGLLGKKTLFRGVEFSHKNKSKSEIINDKNVYEQKYFSLS